LHSSQELAPASEGLLQISWLHKVFDVIVYRPKKRIALEELKTETDKSVSSKRYKTLCFDVRDQRQTEDAIRGLDESWKKL
jgi:NADP-dependent 3-hydroxy acid dehydrogenase YdfG